MIPASGIHRFRRRTPVPIIRLLAVVLFLGVSAATGTGRAAESPALTTDGLADLTIGSAAPFPVPDTACGVLDAPKRPGVSVLVRQGKVTVVAVRTPTVRTRSGIRVGDTAKRLQDVYTDQLTESPKGFLIIGASNSVVMFEIDARQRIAVMRAGIREDVLGGCSATTSPVSQTSQSSQTSQTPQTSRQPKTGANPIEVVRRLQDAYPQIAAAGNDAIAFADGTVMAVEDGRNWPTFDQLLDHADLVDQLSIPYPLGCPAAVPALNDDPGRLRYDPFFARIYGGTAKEVQSHLRSVPWFGSSLQVTTVNDVDGKLRSVANALADHPEWRKYLVSPGGGFNWRPIANTDRRSVHSYGIAVDINVQWSDYWLNAGKYRNRIPCAIAEIFEQHGFIWGGKWFHFDTMHFEYRPELLNR